MRLNSAITEYRTGMHAHPMMVLPKMAIAYVKVSGDYHLLTNFRRYTHLVLDMEILMRGDFSLQTLENGSARLRIVNAAGMLKLGVFEWEFSRKIFLGALVKIQRNVRQVLFRKCKRLDLEPIKAFKQSRLALKLPPELFLHVAEFYFNMNGGRRESKNPAASRQKHQIVSAISAN